jgi:hypothetical protein
MKIGAINMVLQGNSFRYRLIVHSVDVGHVIELSRVTGQKVLDRYILYTTIVLNSVDRCIEIISDIIRQIMQNGDVTQDYRTDYARQEVNEDGKAIIAEP